MSLYDNKNISPMLLSEIREPFINKDYLFELKFDGIRALVFVEPKKILIKSRSGINMNDSFPELLDLTKSVKNRCIFDGEIITMYKGRPSFEKLRRRLSLKNKDNLPISFICFDILYDDKDITNLSLLERKKYLEKYEDNDIFIKSKYYFNDGTKLFNLIKKMKLEGIVAKEIHSKYEIGKRSEKWLKIKNFKDDDFYIGGYKEKNNRGSLASLMLGDKKHNYIGNVSIGKNNPDFIKIKKHKKVKSCPFSNFKEEGFIFIEPNLIATIEFIERTKKNSLRHPIYKSLKLIAFVLIFNIIY